MGLNVFLELFGFDTAGVRVGNAAALDWRGGSACVRLNLASCVYT